MAFHIFLLCSTNVYSFVILSFTLRPEKGNYKSRGIPSNNAIKNNTLQKKKLMVFTCL